MNIPGYVVKIVAGTLLVASVPAGAQILGAGAGGGLNGALGGNLGAQGLGAAGGAGAWGRGGLDGSGTFTSARDRTQQLGDRTHQAAGNASGATRSQAQALQGRTAASAEAAQSAGASAARSAAQTEAQPDAPASPATVQPGSGLLLHGGGSAGAEKQAFGHDISAMGSADSEGSADRTGVRHNGNGKAEVGVSKQEPAPAAEPAQ
jgi:hypothetical protein